MRERCRNPNCRQWPWYGALGIKVCERWETSFDAFLEDMGERPPGTTLDRIDGNKDYEPGNCRWATALEQSRNQRHNVYVEHQGRRVFLRELCEERSLPWMRVYQRIRSGWSVEEALSKETHKPLAVKRGQPAGGAKLTAEQVLTLRTAPRRRGGRGDRTGLKTMQQWADEFGVSLGCVLKAACGATHAHVQAPSSFSTPAADTSPKVPEHARPEALPFVGTASGCGSEGAYRAGQAFHRGREAG
jgi:hypothetical protein